MRLGEFFAGKHHTDTRLQLLAEVVRDGKVVKKLHALNEVALHQDGAARLTELPLYMGDQPIGTLLADGVLIATPTGSTAYALSAGGPIVYPSHEAIVVVPICPHILAMRPLVLPPDRVVSVEVARDSLTLTADGQVVVRLREGDRVRVQRAAWGPTMGYGVGRNYFETLREKLGWGQNFAGAKLG